MVDANIPQGVDTLGKSVSDLQSNIVVDKNSISGTLKYVTGYTGFSGKEEEQSGNYLALHVDCPNVEGVTLSVELVGGTVGHPVELDDDKTIILRITNANTQSIKVYASKEGYADVVRSYSIKSLVLEASA